MTDGSRGSWVIKCDPLSSLLVLFDRLQSVANFRAHVLSRTSISPNLGQQFRWIRGQWQRPFPSTRDRVAPPKATPHRHRQSLPGRLIKDVDDGLTSRHRAILLRSSTQQRLPAFRPTGTAVRFDDVTKHSPPPSTAHQPKDVSGHAYQKPGPASVSAQQTERPDYYSGDSAHRPLGPAHEQFDVAHQRPVVACHPQQPYPGDTRHTDKVYIGEAEQGAEGWSSATEYAPAWSRTMAAPMSRNEATLSFTKMPQTRGPSAAASQFQMQPPRSPDGRSVGGAIIPRPPASLQIAPQAVEPVGAAPMGGASSASPRPPTAYPPTQRPAEPAKAGPAVRREAARQKMAVMERADSVDEDEFDKLVAINYQQLVDAPPTPTGITTLSPPVAADPRRSPRLSPRLARRPSPAEQAPPPSMAPPALGAPPSRQSASSPRQQTSGGNTQQQKTEEESEDELSK